MPGWIDNSFHSHGKRELVPTAVDGLLMRALSRCGDLLTDGFVEASWVRKQLRPSERKRVLELAVRHQVLEPLSAGETCTQRGGVRAGLRREPVSVTVGPFDVDGYVVHDYLDCNRARVEVEQRKAAEAAKKRSQRNGKRQEQLPWQSFEESDVPRGHESVSPGESPGDSGDLLSRGGSTDTSEPGSNDARAPRSKPVTYRGQRVPAGLVHSAERLLAVFCENTGRHIGPRRGDGTASPALTQIVGALLTRPEVTEQQWAAGVAAVVASPPSFVDGPLHIGHVFGERAAEWTLAAPAAAANGAASARPATTPAPARAGHQAGMAMARRFAERAAAMNGAPA